MDRRDALKKLGLGGATLVGASVIVSSNAFAYTGPINIVPMSFNAPTLSGTTTTCTVTAGGAGCTGSGGTGTTAALVSITATVTTVTVSGGSRRFNLNGTNNNTASPGKTTSSTTSPLTFTVIKTTNGGAAEAPALNDAFSVNVTIVYRCSYSNGTNRDGTDTLTRTWRFNGAVWVQA